MYITDLTTQELQELIRLTVIETLDDYLNQPESEVSPIIQQQLIKIRENRQLWIETVYFSNKKEIPMPSRVI